MDDEQLLLRILDEYTNIRLMKKEETNFWDFENPQIQVKSHRTRVLVQRWWNVKIGSSVESVEKQGRNCESS